MAITYYASNRIMNRYFGSTTLTPAVTYYMGVSTTVPQPDGTGVTEPVDVAYARVPITNNKVSFTVASLGSVENDIEFQFAEAQADWGTITHFVLYDSLTAGNLEIYGVLTSPRTVEDQTTLILSANALEITLEECTV